MNNNVRSRDAAQTHYIAEWAKFLGIRQARIAEETGADKGLVSRWFAGAEPSAAYRSAIATMFGIGISDLYKPPSGDLHIQTPAEKTPPIEGVLPNAHSPRKLEGIGRLIPVFGQAVAGDDGEFIMNGNILYEIMAPPVISAIKGAYAIVISGNSMEPRYYDGEKAFIDPTRRVRPGDFVVAQIQMDEHGPPHAFVKRLVKHTTTTLVLEQFNPAKELTFPHERVVSVHFIVMAGQA